MYGRESWTIKKAEYRRMDAFELWCWRRHKKIERYSLLIERITKHASLPCPSPTPRDDSNSCPSSQWCHPTISSPVSSCLQSFPASRTFPMSQLFTSHGQSIGASTSALVLPMNIHGWFPLGLTGLISFQSKGLSRVFSNTTIQKHQFINAQPSLWSSSHIWTWLLDGKIQRHLEQWNVEAGGN